MTSFVPSIETRIEWNLERYSGSILSRKMPFVWMTNLPGTESMMLFIVLIRRSGSPP